MTVLCVIPARAGSKRLPNKNWQKLHGFTLLDRAICAAMSSGVFDDIVVSSDATANVINRSAYRNYFQHFDRPADLRGDSVDIADVVAEVAKQFTHDIVVTLQPATPLRSGVLIREMVTTMQNARCQGAVTMARCVPWIWHLKHGLASNGWSPCAYPRSQDVKDHNLQEINTVQIAMRDVCLSRRRWDLPLLITELPAWATLDIDDLDDLIEARALWPGMKRHFDRLDNFPFHITQRINGHYKMLTVGQPISPGECLREHVVDRQ